MIFGLPWQDLLTIAGFIITATGVGLAVHFAETSNLTWPWVKNYHKIYGNYKIFNYYRERNADDNSVRLISWDVSITRRWVRVPKIHMLYKNPYGQYESEYTGDVFFQNTVMYFRIYPEHKPDDDHSFIVFLRPRNDNVTINSGFLAGYREPIVPYCGVHILCAEHIDEDDAKFVLGDTHDLWFEDYQERAEQVMAKNTDAVDEVHKPPST